MLGPDSATAGFTIGAPAVPSPTSTAIAATVSHMSIASIASRACARSGNARSISSIGAPAVSNAIARSPNAALELVAQALAALGQLEAHAVEAREPAEILDRGLAQAAEHDLDHAQLHALDRLGRVVEPPRTLRPAQRLHQLVARLLAELLDQLLDRQDPQRDERLAELAADRRPRARPRGGAAPR